jgi:glycosidase
VFRRTWGDRALPRDGTAAVEEPFWPGAIQRVRRARPGFLFMAEVYWDLEWTLQQQGFDFTYDKRLYDRLRAGDARSVREHLWANPEFQERSARFLENHDEPRAASVFPPEQHRAAAVITFLTRGLRFLHEGQLEGRRVHVSMHLGRRPDEQPDPALRQWYERLLRVLSREEVHTGHWRLSECRAAWSGNTTWDRFVVMAWDGGAPARLVAAVNYGATRGQCWAHVPFTELAGRITLRDLLGEERYERDAAELTSKGLYLDLPAWGVNAFSLEAGP